ncbi:MAG: NUDIX hydrolase [Chloroflexota bacterium]|nr:NUDIX hydrolase [Chloroflexota bacterium]
MRMPRVVASRRVFDGKMIGVRVDTLRAADSATYEREVVEYGQAVVLVPVDAAGRLLLVRQYRHPVRAWLLELPAGGVDARDASPEDAAQRELREETGHRGTLRRLGGMFLAPGYSTEYQHVYVASELVEDPLDADEDEDLRLERLTLGEALAAVDRGEIRDAKSIAALLMFVRQDSVIGNR